jgi:hypothetical protein
LGQAREDFSNNRWYLFLGFTTTRDLGGDSTRVLLKAIQEKRSWYRSCDILPHGIQAAKTRRCFAPRKWPFTTNGKEEKRETEKAEKNKDPTKFGNPDFTVSFFFRGGNKR